jgi:hypothetical protein
MGAAQLLLSWWLLMVRADWFCFMCCISGQQLSPGQYGPYVGRKMMQLPMLLAQRC